MTSLGLTWSLKLQKALNGRLIILMSSYACLQIYLNGVSYCQVFPSNHNSLNIAGVAGGRMYEVELEVFPKDTMYLPHKSNKLVNVTEWYKFTFSNVIKQNWFPRNICNVLEACWNTAGSFSPDVHNRCTIICCWGKNLVIIGSDNGLAPKRCQDIALTSDDLMSVGSLETNFRI